MAVNIKPEIVTYSHSGSSNETVNLEFTGKSISFYNTGAASATLEINSISIPIPAGDVFTGSFDDFTSIDVIATDTFSFVVTRRQ